MNTSELGLGRFGDRRLEKGGPFCWLGFWPWAGTASGSAVWVGIVRAKSV